MKTPHVNIKMIIPVNSKVRLIVTISKSIQTLNPLIFRSLTEEDMSIIKLKIVNTSSWSLLVARSKNNQKINNSLSSN